jgi:transketolase
LNNDLRLKIAELVYHAGEGHIPSSYSIVDIIASLYDNFLKFDSKNTTWDERDFFFLSKGHGALALYVVLEKHGFITQKDLDEKSTLKGILGGHPDCTKVPGAEASTGSLGHGVVTAMGTALGLKILNKNNKVIALIGDGESNEGTIWEMALVASKQQLGNLCVIVDNNKSAEQILPMHNMKEKWSSFGWDVFEIDGHSENELIDTLNSFDFNFNSKPKLIIANTIKGKGVSFTEGHGPWHHHVPTQEEMNAIKKELI